MEIFLEMLKVTDYITKPFHPADVIIIDAQLYYTSENISDYVT